MYTHVYVTPEDARRLFGKFARKPLRPGEFGTVTGSTLERHFAEYLETYLDKLGATLRIERSEDLFSLRFDRYLPRLPHELGVMEVMPVKCEIVRYNSAPTKAIAGYYEVPEKGLAATVERVYPTQHFGGTPKKGAPLYAQNIWVTGPTLEAAQAFNTKLSTGYYRRALVNAFE